MVSLLGISITTFKGAAHHHQVGLVTRQQPQDVFAVCDLELDVNAFAAPPEN
jgi:hypothetical protein